MRPYKELGDLLASLAQNCHTLDHDVIARHIEKAVGYRVSPHVLAKYLYGSSLPEPEFFRAFAEAFSLSIQERRALAWAHSYGYIPSEVASLSFRGELEFSSGNCR
jgi:hypothetical protein